MTYTYENPMSLAGRNTLSWTKDEMPTDGFNHWKVGYYDDKEAPALMLFSSSDCRGADVSMLVYDRSVSNAGEFNYDDIMENRNI